MMDDACTKACTCWFNMFVAAWSFDRLLLLASIENDVSFDVNMAHRKLVGITIKPSKLICNWDFSILLHCLQSTRFRQVQEIINYACYQQRNEQIKVTNSNITANGSLSRICTLILDYHQILPEVDSECKLKPSLTFCHVLCIFILCSKRSLTLIILGIWTKKGIENPFFFCWL